MKKHEVFETEVNVREQLIRTVEKTGEHLIAEEHYASDDIIKNCARLQETWKTLLVTIDERKKKLDDSLQVQKVRGSIAHSSIKRSIHYLGGKTEFDASSEGPS